MVVLWAYCFYPTSIRNLHFVLSDFRQHFLFLALWKKFFSCVQVVLTSPFVQQQGLLLDWWRFSHLGSKSLINILYTFPHSFVCVHGGMRFRLWHLKIRRLRSWPSPCHSNCIWRRWGGRLGEYWPICRFSRCMKDSRPCYWAVCLVRRRGRLLRRQEWFLRRGGAKDSSVGPIRVECLFRRALFAFRWRFCCRKRNIIWARLRSAIWHVVWGWLWALATLIIWGGNRDWLISDRQKPVRLEKWSLNNGKSPKLFDHQNSSL